MNCYPLANEVAKGYSNATVHPSFRRPSFCNILVNTLESTSYNGFSPNLAHTQSLRESGTLLIFKVIGQRSKVLGQLFTALHPCELSRINIIQWILIKLRIYIVIRRIWKPCD